MRSILLTSIAAVAVILSGWYFLLGADTGRRADSLRKEIEAAQKKAAMYETALASMEMHLQEYARLRDSLQATDRGYDAIDEIASLYRALDSLGNRGGCRLDEITPSLDEVVRFFAQWESAKAPMLVSVRMNLTGGYQPLTRLVADLESSSFFHNLRESRMSGSDKLNPYCQLDITFVAALDNRLELFRND